MKRSHITGSIYTVSAFIFCLSLIISTTSCSKECRPRKGSGSIVSQNYTVASFSAVHLLIDGDVIITKDSVQSVRVEAQENIHNILRLTVSNGELKVDYSKECGSINHSNVKIYISVPEVKSLKISGSGSINTTGNFQTSLLSIDISGSGSITTTSVSNQLKATISGSGSLYLGGTTLQEQLTISGSGDIYAFGTDAKDATIQISGSGNAEVSVSESLEARISGSGDIKYKGNPAVSSSISGSGNLTHVN